MLLSFLSHLRRDVFNELPFAIQMKIVSYIPALPPLHPVQAVILCQHYQRRVCSHCGKWLLVDRDKYICMCRRRYTRVRYSSSLRPYRMYERPSYICRGPSIRPNELIFIEDGVQYFPIYFIMSNQPEVFYSFRRLLHRDLFSFFYRRSGHSMEILRKRTIWKMVNTNTCLRSFSDLFGTILSAYGAPLGIDTRTQFGKVWTRNPNVISEVVVQQYLEQFSTSISYRTIKRFAEKVLCETNNIRRHDTTRLR